MALRLTSRGRARGSTARGTGALLTVALTAGLASQTGTAVADDASDSGAETYLSDLVGKVTETEKELGSLEGELGGLRESVNKSRVDMERNAREAQEAQNQVTDARGRLGGSQDDLDSAQSDLDEIARSAYTQGGDASPVPLASGTSADDAIDRATYIRMATERQQAKVDRLDLARTQAANEESQLRAARDDANSLVEAARTAQAEAQRQFEEVQQQVSDRASVHRKLLDEAQKARDQLAAARAAVDRVAKTDSDASSFDKRRAAEAAVKKVDSTPGASTTASRDNQVAQQTTATPENTATPTAPTTSVTPAGSATVEDPAPATGTEQASGPSAVVGAEAEVDGGGTTTSDETGASLELPAGSSGTGDAGDTSSATGSFTPDSIGDSRRQAAIDGLVDAAGAAFTAGAGAAVTGGNPLSAATTAARDSASRSYADLPTAGAADPDSGVGEDTGNAGNTGHNGNNGDASSPDTSGTVADQIERVINRGMTQLGVTYAWGGGNWYGPTLGIRDGGVADAYGDYAKVGFDCSGLMMYAFYAVGIQLDHYSGYQYTAGQQVPVDQAQRGDMLFWGAGGSTHVALYLGDGTMLEAPQSGSVVQVSDVRWSGIEPMATRLIG